MRIETMRRLPRLGTTARFLVLFVVLVNVPVVLASRVAADDQPPAERAPPWAADAEALLDGVREIAAPGAVPGSTVAFGEDAFPVVLGGAGAAKRVPLVVAARWGKGRVVAAGHGAFLGGGAAATADTGRFVENAVRWTGGAAGGKRPPRVAVVGTDIAATLVARGLEARRLDGGGWSTRLAGVEVLVLGEGSPSDQEQRTIAQFVTAGGGLVTGLCPWGWLQVSRAAGLFENGLQRLLADAGIAFTAATVERTGGKGYVVAGTPGLAFHAARAVELLAATAGKKATSLDVVAASLVAQQAIGVLPPGEKRIRERVRTLLRERAEHLAPTAKSPLRVDRPLDRFLLAVEVAEIAAASPRPNSLDAHPSARDFPGQPPAGAKAVSRRVDVDCSVPGWHSTGLYAVAGRPIRVTFAPTTAPDDHPSGLSLRIGCHADALWHLDAWPRVPEVTLERALDADATTISSAFGGLVYVVVTRAREEKAKEKAVVTIDGAVESPLFVLGETTKEAWDRSRRAPGPWAELGTSKVVLSVPSDRVRELDDPEPLLRFWDRVLDADADLAAMPRERPRPERYVADVEISAGYMHSGYPIMTHLDAAERMVDLALLSTKGDWGLFHEMGHNHQSSDWTFDGTGEVTCNLFTLYALSAVVGMKDVGGHDALASREKKAAEHLKKGAPFSAWKSDPFLALATYVHVIEGFGWDAVKRVFAEYRALKDAERPRSDDEKRDQWLVRLSRATGRNLGPFFSAWGVPTSETARASVAALPAWMPPGFPPR